MPRREGELNFTSSRLWENSVTDPSDAVSVSMFRSDQFGGPTSREEQMTPRSR